MNVSKNSTSNKTHTLPRKDSALDIMMYQQQQQEEASEREQQDHQQERDAQQDQGEEGAGESKRVIVPAGL